MRENNEGFITTEEMSCGKTMSVFITTEESRKVRQCGCLLLL